MPFLPLRANVSPVVQSAPPVFETSMAPRSAARSRGGKTPGTSKKQYRQVKGVRYDDGALVIADEADKISLPVAKAIFEEVQDGGIVTPTEWRTLRYIADGGKDGAQYALTAPARKYLLDLVRAEEGGGEEEEDGDGNLENDIETDEEEDLPATVRKVRGSGGNDAGAGNKRVSFGAARDDVSVGPPIANVNARRRGGGGGGILSPKIAAPAGYEWMPGSDDDDDDDDDDDNNDDRHAPDTDAPPPTTQKPHGVSFASAHRATENDAATTTPAGDRTDAPPPPGIPPGTAHTWLRRRTLDEVDDPLSAAAREADRSGAGRASRGTPGAGADVDDSSGPESDSDESDGGRFVPNSVGGRMRGRANSGGFTVFNVTMPQLTDRVPYSTAAIYVSMAYLAALIAKASLGFWGVKWGGLLWGTGAIGDGHVLSNDGVDWTVLDKEWTKMEAAMAKLAKQVAKATG